MIDINETAEYLVIKLLFFNIYLNDKLVILIFSRSLKQVWFAKLDS